jgi:glycosyltransferase involved in cell wall biosynthesis
MLVDIIIPAYNPGRYLADAIESCLAQEYKNYTITVIDDNSKEDVEASLRPYPEVKYIRNEKNLGPGGARNVGIRATRAPLISLLDSDDIMHPRKLRLDVKAFGDRPELGLTCGNYQILVNRNRFMRPFYKRAIKINHRSLMKQNFVASGSTTFKREVVEDVGLFNEQYWISEDYDMWVRISEKYPIEYIHEVLYYYSVVPSGSSLTQRNDVQKNHLSNIREIRDASRKRVIDAKTLSRKKKTSS